MNLQIFRREESHGEESQSLFLIDVGQIHLDISSVKNTEYPEIEILESLNISNPYMAL